MGWGSEGKLAVDRATEKIQQAGPLHTLEGHMVRPGPRLSPWLPGIIGDMEPYVDVTATWTHLGTVKTPNSEYFWVSICQRGQHTCCCLLCNVSHSQICVVKQAKADTCSMWSCN